MKTDPEEDKAKFACSTHTCTQKTEGKQKNCENCELLGQHFSLPCRMCKPLSLQVLSPLGTRVSAQCPENSFLHPPKDLLQPSPEGRALCSLLITLISSSCGTSPAGEHPASPGGRGPSPARHHPAGTRSLNSTWAQRKGAEKKPFGE